MACAPLILLIGCPQQQTAAPGSAPAQATAPPLSKAVPVATQVAQAPAAPKPQPPENPEHAARVQKIISQAEARYLAGVEDYRSGRLKEARADFDSAVDLMLTSGMDIKSDPQLSDEFEHLLDTINSLEMAALKEGNGFTPKVEASPLEEAANEVTFPPNAALTAKVTSELKTTQSDFPLVINDYVAGFINYFTNSPTGHAHLIRSLERAGKYKDMISKDLKDAGVPQDLIYLAVAESGFQPQALNPHTGAGGMWQFMPFVGAYGLTRNGWFDERFDPKKSSEAYARYMKELYNQFGDWYLAMAAYNWGPGNVQRAVMRTGYADFWELYKRNVLPTQTKNYVPGIIAAIIMAKNPSQYGLDNLTPDPPLVFDTVTVDYAINLRLVADVTNASLQEIVALNPSMLRMTTPDDIPFDLHIPPGTRDLFNERIKSIPPEKRDTWRFHVVAAGESLDGIAEQMHAHVKDIREANDLSASDTIEQGDELVIPENASVPTRQQHYRVRRGDTLVTIADRFNVTVEELRRWNHLSRNLVRIGHLLDVSPPIHFAPRVRGRHSRTHHTRSRRRSSSHTSHSSRGHAKSSSSKRRKK